MSEQGIKWLLLEGALPLLGAGALYILYGFGRWVSSDNKSSFALRIKAAVDPMGWLYGAIIVAMQTGLKGFGVSAAGNMPFWAFGGAAIAGIVLLAAMGDKGQKAGWEPPTSLQIFSGLMVGVILFLGYTTQVRLHPEIAL